MERLVVGQLRQDGQEVLEAVRGWRYFSESIGRVVTCVVNQNASLYVPTSIRLPGVRGAVARSETTDDTNRGSPDALVWWGFLVREDQVCRI